MADERIPDFFKVFFPRLYSEKMKIPTAFTLLMRGNLPEKALLRDQYGNLWLVLIKKIGDDLFFEQGWPKFVADNFLKSGEFLVFKYNGSGTFDVILIGHNLCAKKGVGRKIYVKVKEEPGEENDDEAGWAQEGFEKEVKEEPGEENDDEAGWAQEGFKKEETSDENTDTSDADDSESGHGKMDVDEAEDNNQAFPTMRTTLCRFDRFRNTKRPNQLPLPIQIMKDYNIKLPPTIFIEDAIGRRWLSTVKMWEDGRTWLAGGWKKFCNENNVKPEDKCVCEFVEGVGHEGLFLKIDVVRGGAAPS